MIVPWYYEIYQYNVAYWWNTRDFVYEEFFLTIEHPASELTVLIIN